MKLSFVGLDDYAMDWALEDKASDGMRAFFFCMCGNGKRKREITKKACELYDKMIELNKYPKELDDYYCYLTS